MVAVGAVIEHLPSGKILTTQRSNQLDWQADEWELTYGRIDQFEDPERGLRREVAEETGITNLTIHQVLRVWHIYRGQKTVENDLIGITYHCTTTDTTVVLSDEHAAYQWVDPTDALKLISAEGIRTDVELFMALKKNSNSK